MDYKKISVLIVTYKQADVKGRNIESILQQKEYGLHEIVICDDCSPDNNWDVIQDYVKQYPEIIRAYRNEDNLGIYGNSDKCASLHGDADLFCWLEGDDELCNGFFEAIQKTIVEREIDVTQPVSIQANYLTINPEKEVTRFRNDYLSKHHCNPVSAKIRGLTTWRASVFSKSVIERFKPTILDKGLALAENLFDSQWFKYTDKFYYINIDGSIYYWGIGISVSLNGEKKEKWARESVEKWDYLANNVLTKKRDILYARSQSLYTKFKQTGSFFTYLKDSFFYFMGNIGYQHSLLRILNAFKSVRSI